MKKNFVILGIIAFLISIFLVSQNKEWNRQSLLSKVERFSAVKETSNSNWQNYFYQSYTISVDFPNSYRVNEIFKSEPDRFNHSTIVLEKPSTKSYLFVGDSTIFSTSGDLCIAYKREDYIKISIMINGNKYSIPILKRYYMKNQEDHDIMLKEIYGGKQGITVPEPVWKFQDYVFQIELPPELPERQGKLFVTGQYVFEKDGRDLIDIISTIQW